MGKDKLPVSLVFMVFIACGKKLDVVNMAAILPIRLVVSIEELCLNFQYKVIFFEKSGINFICLFMC